MFDIAEKVCGRVITTATSGSDGFLCKGVYVTERLKSKKDVYLAIQLDRKSGSAEIIYCPIGGFELYKLMKRYPTQIERIQIDSLI